MKHALPRRACNAVAALALVAGIGLATAPAAAAADCSSSTLSYGNTWTEVGELCLRGGAFTARFQTDGNFVIYKGNAAIWATRTDFGGIDGWFIRRSLAFQTDGNVVIYTTNFQGGTSKSATWWTGTRPRGSNMRMVMQADGNLVIYQGSTNAPSNARWASNTAGR